MPDLGEARIAGSLLAAILQEAAATVSVMKAHNGGGI